MMRACSRAISMSGIPGYSLRTSTAPASSPPRSTAARIMAASSSDTTYMMGTWSAPALGASAGNRNARTQIGATARASAPESVPLPTPDSCNSRATLVARPLSPLMKRRHHQAPASDRRGQLRFRSAAVSDAPSDMAPPTSSNSVSRPVIAIVHRVRLLRAGARRHCAAFAVALGGRASLVSCELSGFRQ